MDHANPATAHRQGDTPAALVVTAPLREQVIAHLRSALPNEGVGLLATVQDDSGHLLPCRFFPGTNIRQSPTRYQMDWQELVVALREIDREGWSLGAIVHSHTRGPARPSATDLAEAWYPETLMVIASLASDPPDLRAWTLRGEPGAWVPAEVPILPAPPGGEWAGIAATGNHRE